MANTQRDIGTRGDLRRDIGTHRDDRRDVGARRDIGTRRGVEPSETTTGNRLHRLGALDDFEVADWDPDIRGWSVVNNAGDKIGEIDELIVDLSARKVRYLDIDLDQSFFNDMGDSDRHVLVPIGLARLDEDNDNVIVRDIERQTFSSVPAYAREPITRDYERQVHSAYAATPIGTTTPTREEEDFYAHQNFDVNRFCGPQPGSTSTRSDLSNASNR